MYNIDKKSYDFYLSQCRERNIVCYKYASQCAEKNIVRDKNLSQCRKRNIVSPIRNNRAFDFEGLK